MILAIDVQYQENCGYACGILFADWLSEKAQQQYYSVSENVGDYEPGSFYKRELPCVLDLLKQIEEPFDTIILDGYVYLDGHSRKGLGAHLIEHVDNNVKIIGVAKRSFVDLPQSHGVLRGDSSKALYVTTHNLDLAEAQQKIADMHGPFRLPTLLKDVDSYCREFCLEQSS